MDLFRAAEFTTYVKKLMDARHVPGLSIAILQDDEISSAGFGKASFDPPQECTPDTLFDIASASKSLTTASAALLVHDNVKYPLVQYETPMSSLLPGDFVMPGEEHGDVTLEDILSHRTGMAPNDYSYLGSNAAQPDDAHSITRNLRNLPVKAKNRTEYHYCNMMFTVATYLVERISGLHFDEFLESYIFRPLGMHSTNLQPCRARAKGLGDRLATGYFWNDDTEEYHPIPCSDSPEAQGAGRVITCANDYIKWVKAIMNHEGPITQGVYEGLIKKRISETPAGKAGREKGVDDPRETFYAAGWQILEYGAHTMVWHDGADDGFRSIHFFVPELKFGGVILANSDRASDILSTIMYKLVDWVGHAQKFGESPDVARMLGSEPVSDSESDHDDYGEDEDDEDDDDDASSVDSETRMKTEMCPELKEPMPQTVPLSSYIGQYWNAGYRGIKVEEKDGALFVDATDRSMRFTLIFEHVCEQKKYIAHLHELPERYKSHIKAEFKFEGNKAVELGLHLEEVLEEYIWFTRTGD